MHHYVKCVILDCSKKTVLLEHVFIMLLPFAIFFLLKKHCKTVWFVVMAAAISCLLCLLNISKDMLSEGWVAMMLTSVHFLIVTQRWHHITAISLDYITKVTGFIAEDTGNHKHSSQKSKCFFLPITETSSLYIWKWYTVKRFVFSFLINALRILCNIFWPNSPFYLLFPALPSFLSYPT